MNHDNRLPLFPLQAVLFPDSALPLHIFEERYKTLIHEVKESGGEFGINFVTPTAISAVGCTAVVQEVIREYDDGRMDIVVRGKRRYRLTDYDAERTPYLVGSVQFLAGPDEQVDEALAEETTRLYNILMKRVFGDDRYRVERSASDSAVSFVLAQKAGLDLSMRQKLLEVETENGRLGILKQYLVDVMPKIDQVEELERIIRNDGYLSP